MSEDAYDIAEWLGAEVGGKLLPEKVSKALKKSFEDEEWDESFIPEDGTLSGAELKDAVEHFVSILDDSSGYDLSNSDLSNSPWPTQGVPRGETFSDP